MRTAEPQTAPTLAEITREWGRIGCIGFGGPPAHVTLLHELCVTRRAWLSDDQFERALAAVNLLPGPASTQLAIYCAWRLRGNRGALLGGLCFVLPGLVLILVLSTLFLAGSPPRWVRGAGMGAGAAVAAVAVRAGMDFLVNMGDSWLSNTPRRGAVALRTTMQHSETQLCIACHPAQLLSVRTMPPQCFLPPPRHHQQRL